MDNLITLDRVAKFDDESRKYAAVQGDLATFKLRSYRWYCDQFNDQGREGACVGFGWGHELSARPYPIRTSAIQSQNIYLAGKAIDEWEGEDYSGTSVLAGAKATQMILNSRKQSVMAAYRWAFGLEDVIRVLGYRGPVVLGVNWYADMFNTDELGFIRRSGKLSGGHCILIKGVKLVYLEGTVDKVFANLDLEKSYVLLHNSWGLDWGGHIDLKTGLLVEGGCARLTLDDLHELLVLWGDACIPTIRRYA